MHVETLLSYAIEQDTRWYELSSTHTPFDSQTMGSCFPGTENREESLEMGKKPLLSTPILDPSFVDSQTRNLLYVVSGAPHRLASVRLTNLDITKLSVSRTST